MGLNKMAIFFEAIRTGDSKTILKFLEEGINPNVQYHGMTALYYSILNDQAKIVRLLLDFGADPNLKEDYFGRTSIFFANLEITALLLAAGADPNARDYDSYTPLAGVNKKVAKLLLLAGADPNVKNNNGGTLLDSASENDNIRMIHLLLRYGA